MGAVAGKKLDAIKCPLCDDFLSKRLTSFDTHLLEQHQTTSKELWVKINGKVLCKCGCGGEPKWINWKIGFSSMILGHNANIYAVYDEETAKKLAEARGSNWRGKESHWKGKTKETDERVASRAQETAIGRKAAFDAGTIEIWSKGKTKETDERVAQMAENQKAAFESGKRVTWTKGKTKETDERVAQMALNVSITHKNKEVRERLDELKRLSKEEVLCRVESNKLFDVSSKNFEYVRRSEENILVKCKKCQIEISTSLHKLMTGVRCKKCYPVGSAGEAGVSQFIESLGLEVINNTRQIITPLEIDVYIPALKFGIECNGLYTHNELSKSQIYHSNKTEMCLKKGVKLFHVFEDEWNEKQEIVKSMIAHRIHMTKRKIFARKCVVRELSVKQRRDFFDSCHIDGDTNSKIAWGLFYEDELVSALSLRKAFHKKHEMMLEIARFCTALHTSVVGGLAKLTQVALKHSIAHGFRNGLLTYVDTRFGQGEGYKAAGFSMVGRTPNRFWWTDTFVRFNRFKFRADKRAGLTEHDIASEHGVIKIWGCPNLIFELKA